MTTQCSSLQPYAAVSQLPKVASRAIKGNWQAASAQPALRLFPRQARLGGSSQVNQSAKVLLDTACVRPGEAELPSSLRVEEAPNLFSVRLGLCHALVLERAVVVVGLLGTSFAAHFGVLNQPFEFYVPNVLYQTVLRPRRITRFLRRI